MMENNKLGELLDKYLTEDLSAEEKQELAALAELPENHPHMELFVEMVMTSPAYAADTSEHLKEKLFGALGLRVPAEQASTGKLPSARKPLVRRLVEEKPLLRNSLFRKPFIRYAAAALLLLGAGIYFWLSGANTHTTNTPPPIVQTELPIPPGSNGAILVLADGKQVILDSLANGLVAYQPGSEVRLDQGKLNYSAGEQAAGAIAYNTVSTPKGRYFSMTLPDGSKVWLNAGSSIRFPTHFPRGERVVDLTGEAYFEVAKNAKKPFRVNANGRATVEVLGTHFNISAYSNEAGIKTTLLEGSVRMRTNTEAKMLEPLQQASLLYAGDTKLKITGEVDVDKVMAWKNGYFNFNDVDLGEAMRQLERWYNIEVVYKGAVPENRYGGSISRNMPLSELLRFLEGAGLQFRLEGERLIIL